jgi:uncharacterized membrane protein HdeD (DUF308 family)
MGVAGSAIQAGPHPSPEAQGRATRIGQTESAIKHKFMETLMLSALSQRWWVLLLRGICAIALGITAIAWPEITLISLVYLFGIFTLIDGAAAIVLGIRGESDGTVWWTMILLGVLAIAAAIVTLGWPVFAGLWLLAIIAATAIARGVLEIVAAIKLRKELDDEWILALSGAMSVLFGVLIFRHPGAGAVAIVLLIGAYMLALGAFAVALSLRLRRLQHKLAPR